MVAFSILTNSVPNGNDVPIFAAPSPGPSFTKGRKYCRRRRRKRARRERSTKGRIFGRKRRCKRRLSRNLRLKLSIEFV